MKELNDKIYNIKLNKKELNIIINGLSKLAFQDVYKIIEKIHLEVNSKSQESEKS